MQNEVFEVPRIAPVRRAAARFKLRVPVEYRVQFDVTQGRGLLWNISRSGLRIEQATAPVAPGTKIEVRFSFFPGSFETELSAEVVRRTHMGGFAARFCGLAPHQSDMLLRLLPTVAPLE